MADSEVPNGLTNAAEPVADQPSAIDQNDAKGKLEKDVEAEKALETVTWDYDQNEESISLHIDVPSDAGKVTARTLSVKVDNKNVEVSIAGKRLINWTLFNDVETGEEELELWSITDGKEGGKVLNLELQKKEKEMWPFVIVQRLPPNDSYFLTEAELAAARKDEIAKDSKEEKEEDAEEKDEKDKEECEKDENGLPIKAEVEDFGNEDEQKMTTQELWESAMQSFGGEDIAEGIRKLRVLAIHRNHSQSCLTLHKVYGDERNWGVPKSKAKALWFLKLASEFPEPEVATFLTLARYYELGALGLPSSWSQAIKYYQKGASEGHCTAISQTASLLMRGSLGRHQPTNKERSQPERAGRLIQSALRRGCPHANIVMGDWYLRSEAGFDRDVQKAKKHYEQATKWLPDIRAIVPWSELAEALYTAKPAEGKTEAGSSSPTSASMDEGETKPTGGELTTAERIARMERAFAGKQAPAAGGDRSSLRRVEKGAWFSVRFWENTGTVLLASAVLFTVFRLSQAN